MTAAIEHIHFLCADPEKTAAFFATYLDAVEVERVTMPDWLIVRIQVGPTIIALSPKRGDQVLAEPPAPPYRGFSHIGVIVSAVDDLVERMRGDGVPVTIEPFEIAPGMRAAYVLAPDDIELELLQPPQS